MSQEAVFQKQFILKINDEEYLQLLDLITRESCHPKMKKNKMLESIYQGKIEGIVIKSNKMHIDFTKIKSQWENLKISENLHLLETQKSTNNIQILSQELKNQLEKNAQLEKQMQFMKEEFRFEIIEKDNVLLQKVQEYKTQVTNLETFVNKVEATLITNENKISDLFFENERLK